MSVCYFARRSSDEVNTAGTKAWQGSRKEGATEKMSRDWTHL